MPESGPEIEPDSIVDETDSPSKPPERKRARLPRQSSKRWGMNPADRMRVMEACLVLPGPGWIMHFALMMIMSVLVAIMGLSANSPALVIGAMLIAPLMTPVLGVAASISMALGDAATRAALTVTAATVGAIALSWLIAGVLPGELLTPEVLSRTAPDARDLVVALAAGVAGSYATARPDVSSSLPGVAIAVALVPPLAVVGITMRAGEPELARGAFLLYGTNLAAIVTVSTIVFVVAGFVPGRRLLSMAPRVLAGALIGLALVVVLGVLLVTRSIDSAREANDIAQVREATDTWLAGSFNESEVEVDGSTVRVQVTGPTQPPSSAELSHELEQILGLSPDLRVTWIQGQTSDALRAAEAEQSRSAETAATIRETIDQWLLGNSDGSTYDITLLDIESDGVTLEVSSIVDPPPLEDLLSRLQNELGTAPPVLFTWRDLSAEEVQAGLRTIDELESDARLVVQDWAASRDLAVDDVEFDGETLVVNLVGQLPPDGSSLETELVKVVDEGTEVRVYFIERVPVIPAPTPTPTPTPEPTPTPTPEPTPAPTPTPDFSRFGGNRATPTPTAS